MGAIGFYLFYSINWVVTLLPLRVLYLFSDLLFPVFYHVVRYRRTVVATNLRNAFPEKSENERKTIEKKFYHHLCDLIFETLKLVHLGTEQHKRRLSYSNPELLDRLYDEGRNVVAISGHYGNWEWTNIFPLYNKFINVQIYKPLQNKYFDGFFNNLRTKYGLCPVPMSNIVREIINNRKNNRQAIYGFMSDQTPPRGEIKFWTTFLNQDTPVYLGAEKISVKYDMAVVFANIQKTGRGFYTLTFEVMFEHTSGLPEHLITQTHVKRLEEIIRNKPEYWLWSHRRWKYKREKAND